MTRACGADDIKNIFYPALFRKLRFQMIDDTTHEPDHASLERTLDNSDFAIVVAQPDDLNTSRGSASAVPRDNVIFELGVFIGRIGRHRSSLVEPRGEEKKLPSDLCGITALSYRHDASELAATLGPAYNRIHAIIKELGPNN